ncbi:MAG TPA: type II secretion system F family protein [Methylophilaceae bacterium]|jgi:general secretion pathway protein F
MNFDLKVALGDVILPLSIEADDIAQARLFAEAQGYSVLAARVAGRTGLGFLPHRTKKTKFNLLLFSQELLALLDSGLSLIEAIETLEEKEQLATSKALLAGVMKALYEGQTLSGALDRFPHVFPALYVALIRASERTGDMVHALSRHVTYQGQVDALRKKIVTASIYPVLLLVVGGVVILFLLGYVVPRFSTIYESAGSNLPWMSQILLAWGQMLQKHGNSVLMIFLLSSTLIVYALSQPALRAVLIRQFWKIPALGETLRIYQLASFYRTLGMLLRGGIPLVTGMQMGASLLQPNLRDSLVLAEREVREGKTLSSTMEQYGMTTSVALRMLRVGERTGSIGEMMERIGAFYDGEIERVVDWFTRLLEPILMAVIGLVIGVVVVLMYMPIFDLAGSVQ